ncbi:MAG: metallophosphoesterase family protein [Promethearchaeia archaeon]
MSNTKKNTNKKFSIIFLLTAIFSIIFLGTLIIALNDFIRDAFLNLGSDDDAIYWVLGTIIVSSVFGLISAYMVYNKVKNNYSLRAKILAGILLPLLILGTIFGIIYSVGMIVPQQRGPYLSWMDDPRTTMTISFETRKKQDFKIKFGKGHDDPSDSHDLLNLEDSFNRIEKRDYDGYYHYTITLTNLDPDTRYYYQIPKFIDKLSDFKTAPNSTTSSYKFILYGDSRESNRIVGNQHYSLIDQMETELDFNEFSFIINTGDTAREHDEINLWNIHFDAIRDIARNLPYFVASGNHEWNNDDSWNLKDQPALDIQDFPEEDNPSSNIYSLNEVSYSFGFSNSFFIFIGYPHAGSKNTEYINWLEQQLDIGNSSYDFTFVSLHRPPFDDREGDDGDDNPDIIKNECPLFHNYCVEAVFNGHNHVLAHQKIQWDQDPFNRDVNYVISGGGGANLRNPQYGKWDNTYNMGFSGKTEFCTKAYHYYIIEVDGENEEATFTAYELGGNELERFTINAIN